jgi:hypothetical protein
MYRGHLVEKSDRDAGRRRRLTGMNFLRPLMGKIRVLDDEERTGSGVCTAPLLSGSWQLNHVAAVVLPFTLPGWLVTQG